VQTIAPSVQEMTDKWTGHNVHGSSYNPFWDSFPPTASRNWGERRCTSLPISLSQSRYLSVKPPDYEGGMRKKPRHGCTFVTWPDLQRNRLLLPECQTAIDLGSGHLSSGWHVKVKKLEGGIVKGFQHTHFLTPTSSEQLQMLSIRTTTHAFHYLNFKKICTWRTTLNLMFCW
jgi:hypothetical protein